jgi:predicted ABC-type transport system involved in lysophospholipase L1 biosynthesis ATPase subunit
LSQQELAAPAAIRTEALVKSYGTPAAAVHALRGVSLSIGRGERVALLGKSGSGKSTLLNVIGGLDRPTAGMVEVAGRDLGRMNGRDLARHRLATVGMVFQSFNLIPSRTALENVELPMVFAGQPPKERRAAARRALEAFGLGERLHHRPPNCPAAKTSAWPSRGPWSTAPASCWPTSRPATWTAPPPGRS